MEKINRKILVIGVLFLLLGASAMLSASASNTTTGPIRRTIPAIRQDIVAQTSYVGNVQISTVETPDFHPRMTTNALGDIVVVYEEQADIFTTDIPVVYSADDGATWTQQYLINSLDFQGSGILGYPDIIYNAAQDLLFIGAVDPNADMYNDEMFLCPGDIAASTELNGYAISGTTSTGYLYTAVTCTPDYFLSVTTEDYPGFESIFGLGWFTSPDWAYPPALGGYYYDGQSLFPCAPVANAEMDFNANRVFLAFESTVNEVGTQVAIKSGSADKALIDSGEQQNGMDKYGDVEQMPGVFLGFGTDPDVSGSGSNVVVVFVQDGNVVCMRSSCGALYEPEFNWQTSTVDTGASTPSVYMQGNVVYCAYVKNGNLFYKISEDGGATWGTAEQKNDVNGKVVSDTGSVDLCGKGIAFVDNRDGDNDIWFAAVSGLSPDAPTIIGPASGKAGKEYEYTITTTDGQGDQVLYYIDWGDNTNTGWIGPYASGDVISQMHTWADKANYTITAKAKDTAGHESDWGTLTISMPLSLNLPFYQIIGKLFERFPHWFPMLRQLLGY